MTTRQKRDHSELNNTRFAFEGRLDCRSQGRYVFEPLVVKRGGGRRHPAHLSIFESNVPIPQKRPIINSVGRLSDPSRGPIGFLRQFSAGRGTGGVWQPFSSWSQRELCIATVRLRYCVASKRHLRPGQ